MKTSLKLLAILVIGATARTGQAALLVEETFQGYTAGNLIGQAEQGTGLSGSWTNPVANGNVTFTVQNSGGMSYSGGNISVNGGSQYGRASSTATVTGNNAANIGLSTPLTYNGTGTTYISFLMRFGGTLETNDQFSLQLAVADNDTSFSRTGVRDDTSTAPNDVSFLANNSSSVYPVPEVIVTAGTTYFVVLKLDVGGSGWTNASLWLDPTQLTEAGEGAADAIRAQTNNNVLNYLGFKFQQPDSGDSFDLDEIRIGTTWSDVAVPEPSAWMLLAAAGTFFVITRRRRRS